MLVSGMLFSCTNNTDSKEQQAADSTAQVTQSSVIPAQTEEVEAEEAEIEEAQEGVSEDELSN